MSSLRATMEGNLRYRGGEAQLSYILHRISGLGTLLFLAIHILDTATVYFFPSLYADAINLYRSTPFMIGEIILVFLVLYHGANGLRIALFDLFPHLWQQETQRQGFHWVLAVAILLWLPAAFLMGRNLLIFNFLVG
jgi:succinate dehydrogenase / fumarate reductase cytochrome b subunit